MDEPELKAAVLKKLVLWPRGLTESDVVKLVRPLVLWPGTLEEMAMLGLIDLRPIGDEPVARITDQGREWLEHRGRP